MFRIARLVSFVALVGLFAAVPALRGAAQDGSPAAGTPSAMSEEQTRAVLDPYLAALEAREDIAPYFAGDVVLTLVEVGQEIRGRDAVAGAIDALHQQTFDASPEVVNLVVGEGAAAGEFIFAGTHTGEFAGIPATGRQVNVPYAVFYDLADGQITALRIYGFASGLVAQLTAEASPVAGTPSARSASDALSITKGDGFFEPARLEIPADTDVTMTLVNSGQERHTFSIDALGPGRTGLGPTLLPGQTHEFTFNAAPGEYQFSCQIPGHKEAGMTGTLAVS